MNKNKSVTSIKLDNKNIKTRAILLAVFVFISIGAVGFGIKGLLDGAKGWQSVSANMLYDAEFEMNYFFDSAKEKAQFTIAYQKYAEESFKLFNDELDEGLGDLAELNQHPNEKVRLDPYLYQCLKEVADETTLLYLAPINEVYSGLFMCQADHETADFYPRVNDDLQAYLKEILAYIANGDIQLEFCGSNEVILHVSEAYKAFGELNGFCQYIDFGWLKNACRVDYIADHLIEDGYHHGYLASYDGYIRSFNAKDETMSYWLRDCPAQEIIYPAEISCQGDLALVTVRNFIDSDYDRMDYYRFESGQIVSRYLDERNGYDHLAYDSITLYDEKLTCLTLALKLYRYDVLEETIDPDFANYVIIQDQEIHYFGHQPENILNGYQLIRD